MTDYTPPATKIVNYTAVDFGVCELVPSVIRLMQYCSGIDIIAVKLYKNGEPFSLKKLDDIGGVDPVTAIFKFTRADGTSISITTLGGNPDPSTEQDRLENPQWSTIYFIVSHAMTLYYSKYRATIQIEKAPDVTYTGYIPLDILKNPVQTGTPPPPPVPTTYVYSVNGLSGHVTLHFISPSTESNKIYATDADGEQIVLSYTNLSTANTIAARDSSGRLRVVSPSDLADAVNLGYLRGYAVTYTGTGPSLTDEQKANARTSIGVSDLTDAELAEVIGALD